MKRDSLTLPLDLGSELIVDNFAGGGGASTGIERAFGRPVDIAINHDGEALAMHAANHPETQHLCEDVFDIHPGFVTQQRPIGLAWFSPDCTHHSKAKGGKPREKKIRGLAWVTLRWATFQYPRAIALENVEEFADWGPLGEDGRPIKSEKGRTFRAFVAALTTGLPADHPDTPEIYQTLGADFPMKRLAAGLGYKVEWRVLRACDLGAPTIRKRLYLFARRDGLPIVWPAPTHGDPKSAAVRAGKLQPWRTAADCIDWSIPCPSIFERERPLKDATLRRIARGIMKFVVNADDPFIVLAEYLAGATLIQTGYGERAGQAPRVPGLGKPLGTTVAGGAKHALVTAFLAKHYGGHESPGAPLDAPISTITTQDHHHPVMAQLVGCGGRAAQSRPRDAAEPTATITAKADTAIAVSHLIKLQQNSVGQDAREPLHTVMAGAPRFGEVRAFLIKYYGNEKDGVAMREPLHTVPTHDRFGLVTIHGEDYAIVDIGMRMLTPRELARAQGFPDNYVLDPVVNGKPLSKSAQVRMIGNSVCPDVAAALIRANFSHEQQIAHVAA
ncbi:DNA methyltransferase [Burkholderia ubonensis]|uniref:DNA cytosine methyltransferase n=1 Tax=Burkholderia ubonensis TaxID=101571 RepID=UPI000758FD09|nr:DNA cytosine methyltransferase [Burkholderia ubonensis]KVO95523.1 DNA methyltransferase [Burkholderia ubonensis]KVZ58446.1 DNA methyltransferase [Burkholderia ubonensis]KVZ75159.1 DNA methyltransferase [Burkholderia ubonensis]